MTLKAKKSKLVDALINENGLSTEISQRWILKASLVHSQMRPAKVR